MWSPAMRLKAAQARIAHLGREVAQLRTELDRATIERDTYARQLEEAVRRGMNLERRLGEVCAEAASLRESLAELDRANDRLRRAAADSR